MKQQGSNFVTPAGIIIVAVLIPVAAFFHMTALEALLAAVLLLSLIAWFWGRNALSHLHIGTADTQCRSFPGDTMETEVTIKNDKFLPLLWLEVRFPLTVEDPIAPPENSEETTALKSRFLWIMPRQTVTFTQQAQAKKRGVARYETLNLSSGDGFGLSSLTKEVHLHKPFRFIVYPKIHDVNLSPIENRLRELENHRNGYYTDQTLISSIRDYQMGDSIKNISWRQLARTGKLQTNVHETMRMSRFCMILNLQSFVYYKKQTVDGAEKLIKLVHAEELEDMLSLAASIAVRAQEQGLICSLVIPATGTTPAKIIIPESISTQSLELLTALAELRYQGEDTTFPTAQMEEQLHLLGRGFLLSHRLKKRDLEELKFPQEPIHILQIPAPDLPAAHTILDAKELLK